MIKLYISVLAFLVCSVTFAGNSPGQPKDPLPGVKTNLVISVEEYDPSRPSKGVVKCIVVNKSKNPVEVFLGYDGGWNQLWAVGSDPKGDPAVGGWERRLGPLKLKEELKRVRVEPGQELVVFELSLDEILLQGLSDDPRTAQGRKWGWGAWQAHPIPPPSPIHRTWGVFEKAVFFWSQIEVQGKILSSEKVTLRVKSGTEKPR